MWARPWARGERRAGPAVGSLPGQMGGEGASIQTGSQASLLPVPHPGAPPAWPPQCLLLLPPRLPRETLAFREELDILKFLCKDLWVAVFHKQMDSLRTNHQVCAPRADSGQRPEPREPREGTQAQGSHSRLSPPRGLPTRPPRTGPSGLQLCLGLTRLVCTRASFPLGTHAGPGWWPDGLGCIFSPPGTLEIVQQGRGGEDTRPWSEGPRVLI